MLAVLAACAHVPERAPLPPEHIDNAEVLELNNAALNALMEQQPHLGYVIVRRIAVIEAQRLRSSND